VTELSTSQPEWAAGSKSDLAGLARGGSLNLVGAGISALLTTVLLVLVARGFRRADAGVFFVATSLFLIVTTGATVGADTGVLRFIPRYRALHRHQDIPRVLWCAMAPVAVLSTALGVALFVLAPTIGDVAVGSARGAQFSHVVRVLAPFVPLVVLYNVVLAATRGFVTMRPTVLIERVGRSILQCGAVGLALVHPSLTRLTLAWALPYSVATVAAVGWLLRLLHGVGAGPANSAAGGGATRLVSMQPADDNISVFRELWSFSALRGVARIFAVALQRFDIVLVGALRGPADAAVYTAASRFLVIGTMAVQAIQQVMAPRMSQLLAAGAHDRATTLYQTATGWLVAVSWPLYLSFAVFAPWFLAVFGHGYRAGESVVVILCLAMLVACGCGSVDSVLLMGGRSSWSLLNSALAFATDVVIDLILVPRIGIVGAAIGWAAALLVGNLLPLAQVHYLMHMHPFGAGARTVTLLAFGCFGLVPLHVRAALGTGSDVVLVTLATASAGYAAGLWRARQALGTDALGALFTRRGRPARKAGVLINAR
jgi:O-antigen/teichoic acid export membrane protein